MAPTYGPARAAHPPAQLVTVIAGLVTGPDVLMLCDDHAVDGGGRLWPNSRKITRVPVGNAGATALIGTCGHSGLSTLTRAGGIKLDAAPDPRDAASCNDWADAVGRALTDMAVDARPPLTDDGGHVWGQAMLAHAGRLWGISEHGAWPVDRFCAIGSGGDLALGALDALLPLVDGGSVDARDALEAAGAAAVRWNEGCNGSLHLHVL